MSTKSEWPTVVAVSVGLLISAEVSAQTTVEDPGDTVPPTESESNLQLRDAPEQQLSGIEALESKPGGLTADQVAERAVKSSPTIRARRAEIAAAQARVDNAVAQFLPRLSLKAMYRRVSPVDAELEGAIVGGAEASDLIRVIPCPDDPMQQCAATMDGTPVGARAFEFPILVDNYSLNAQLSLPLSDYLLRLSKSLTATDQNLRAAELQKQAETLKTESDARVAYYNWLRTVGGGAVAKSSLHRYQALLKDAQTAFELGTVTKADVLRLEAAVAGTEAAIAETESLQSLSEEQLATLMNQEVQKYQVGENIRVDTKRMESFGKLTSLVEEANQHRLELKVLKAANRSLEAGAAALRISQWPRLDAFGDVTYANPNIQIFPQTREWNATWAVGLSLSWTLNDAFSSSAQSDEIEASRAKLMADRANLERGIKMEVTSAYYDMKKARAAIEASSRGSTAAQEAYRVARDLYQVGRATTTDLIVAETELVAALLKEINAALDYHIAKVKLMHALGRNTVGAS